MRLSIAAPGPGVVVTRHRVRVGYVDTDKAGIVHHSVYLVWFEAARIEYLRERGLDYRRFEIETGLALPVIETHLRHRAPARFDDELIVTTWVSKCSRAMVAFESRITRGDDILCESRILLACANVREEHAVSLPEAVTRACS